jgi:putative membrane protein
MKKNLTLAVLGLSLSFGAFALSDSEVSKVLMTANEGEVELATVARDQSRNPKVKSFAEHMIKDHDMNNGMLEKIIDKKDLSPTASTKSETIKQDGRLSKEMLSKLKGSAFDKAYIDDQVKTHQMVLENLEKTLIPSAKSQKLKAHLTMTKEKVAEHLKHAQEIQKTL